MPSVVWWAPSWTFCAHGKRRVFQSKLGVPSSNQCNLHHSPHTGHLEKKIKKGYNLFRTRCIMEHSESSLSLYSIVTSHSPCTVLMVTVRVGRDCLTKWQLATWPLPSRPSILFCVWEVTTSGTVHHHSCTDAQHQSQWLRLTKKPFTFIAVSVLLPLWNSQDVYCHSKSYIPGCPMWKPKHENKIRAVDSA